MLKDTRRVCNKGSRRWVPVTCKYTKQDTNICVQTDAYLALVSTAELHQLCLHHTATYQGQSAFPKSSPSPCCIFPEKP